jgi:hypothetical protein
MPQARRELLARWTIGMVGDFNLDWYDGEIQY